MSDLSDHAEYDGNVIRVDVSGIDCETVVIPATPNSELRGLIEELSEKANHTEAFEESFGRGLETGYNRAVHELEELIGDG